MKNYCKTCHWLDKHESSREYGICRKDPPKAFPIPNPITKQYDAIPVWPLVKPEEDRCSYHTPEISEG